MSFQPQISNPSPVGWSRTRGPGLDPLIQRQLKADGDHENEKHAKDCGAKHHARSASAQHAGRHQGQKSAQHKGRHRFRKEAVFQLEAQGPGNLRQAFGCVFCKSRADQNAGEDTHPKRAISAVAFLRSTGMSAPSLRPTFVDAITSEIPGTGETQPTDMRRDRSDVY